jgi:VCBS repeat-containing protein
VATSAALDFETIPTFHMTVLATDNGTPVQSVTGAITIHLIDVNEAPVVNDQTFTVAENTANGTTVGTIVATDPDAGQTRTFSVTGGTGQTAFAVSAAGVITVANSAALNFEVTPTFTLNVTVTDNATPTMSDTAVITINLTNVNEAPVITSNGGGATASINVPENNTAVNIVTVDDPDAGTALTFSLSGTDADKFVLSGTGSSRVIFFIAPPDFEAPTDAGHNNVYDVSVQVSDGVLTDSQAIAVNVTDVAETVNKAPVAANDTATTNLHTPVTISVLTNDTDDGTLVPSSVAIGTDPVGGSVLMSRPARLRYATLDSLEPIPSLTRLRTTRAFPMLRP